MAESILEGPNQDLLLGFAEKKLEVTKEMSKERIREGKFNSFFQGQWRSPLFSLLSPSPPTKLYPIMMTQVFHSFCTSLRQCIQQFISRSPVPEMNVSCPISTAIQMKCIKCGSYPQDFLLIIGGCFKLNEMCEIWTQSARLLLQAVAQRKIQMFEVILMCHCLD